MKNNFEHLTISRHCHCAVKMNVPVNVCTTPVQSFVRGQTIPGAVNDGLLKPQKKEIELMQVSI